MPGSNWVQEFWNLLCWFYQQIGRDCANLPKPLPDAAQSLYDKYQDERPPTFANEQERLAFRGKLDELEAMLDDEACTLDQATKNLILAFIEQARADSN